MNADVNVASFVSVLQIVRCYMKQKKDSFKAMAECVVFSFLVGNFVALEEFSMPNCNKDISGGW
jgi:hypothetical protein